MMTRCGVRAFLILAPLFSALLLGQEVRSTILGRVIDPQSTAVAGAAVVVTNTDTNVSVRLQTNDTGYYEANFLLPGPYQVKATATGFKEAVRGGIALLLHSRLAVDLQLSLGEVTDSITVSGDAPLLETTGVSAGRTLDTRTLRDLPVFYNNSMDLMRYAPGAFTSGQNQTTAALHSTTAARDPQMAGGAGQNSFVLDGAPNVTSTGSGPTFPANSPSVDTVQEVKVETFNFDASMSGTGINVSMLTKLGTNQFHGSAADQMWQQRWNGTPFFTRQLYYRNIAQAEGAGDHARAEQLRALPQQPSGHANNYAATLGGPVILPKIFNGRDKLFFFLSYNGTAFRSTEPPSTFNRTVPTMAERDGNFSDLLTVDPSLYQLYDPFSIRPDPNRAGHFVRDPLPGNVLPQSRINNPTYAWYKKILPVPNQNPAGPGQEPTSNYLASATPQVWDYKAIMNRFDYRLSEKHAFFFRWIWDDFASHRVDWTYSTLPGFTESYQYWQNKGATFDWVYTINSATVFNITVSDNYYGSGNRVPPSAKVKPSAIGFPKYMDEQAGDNYIAPMNWVAGYEDMGPMNGVNPAYSFFRIPSAKAALTHIRGNHTINAGFSARRYLRTRTLGGNTTGNFSYDGSYFEPDEDGNTAGAPLGASWAAFMSGLPVSGQVEINDSLALQSTAFSWYGQDNFRVTPKLSLTLGLRLDYETGPSERYDRILSGFDSSLTLPITDGAKAAYAANPIPELSPSAFAVTGGAVYPGTHGAGHTPWPNQWMWAPRISAAYQINPRTVIRAGYGIFHDNLTAWSNTPNQLGYSRTTVTSSSSDFGQTWNAGDPAHGVSIISDPFPIRSNGTRFDQPLRNTLGDMALAGSGTSIASSDAKHARQQRWRVGVQHQIGASTVIDIAYAGAYADMVSLGGGSVDTLNVTRNINTLPGQYYGSGNVRATATASNLSAQVPNPFYIDNLAALRSSNPLIYDQVLSNTAFFWKGTVSKSQLLLPYPQMAAISTLLLPLGKVRTDELELGVEKRFARGFSLNANYTRLRNRTADFFYNPFDVRPSYREGTIGRPQRFSASGIYELPFGKGRTFFKQGLESAIFGGFQIAATYEWQPGQLLSFDNLFYYGDNLDDIKSGPRTLNQWFNTANFERNPNKGPVSYQTRVFPSHVDGLRGDQTNLWNTNVQRNFKIFERASLEVRAEAINLTNRTLFALPNTNPYSTNFGKVTAQTNTFNRFLQFQARLRF